MNKQSLLFCGVLLMLFLLASCVVHHRMYATGPRPYQPAVEPAPPPPPPPEQVPPPQVQPVTAGPEVHRAPPAQAVEPGLAVQVVPDQARRGQEVSLYVTPFQTRVMVYYNGQPLPKKVQNQVLTVTVPANAVSGYFDVEWNGRRYRSQPLTVLP